MSSAIAGGGELLQMEGGSLAIMGALFDEESICSILIWCGLAGLECLAIILIILYVLKLTISPTTPHNANSVGFQIENTLKFQELASKLSTPGATAFSLEIFFINCYSTVVLLESSILKTV